MDLKDILKDALIYPFSDFKLVILLGLVLLMADLVNEVPVTDVKSAVLKLILVVVALIMSILEAGYLFNVIEETIQGSDMLPKFSNLRSIFVHGIKEIFVTTMYILIPIFLLIISYLFLYNSDSHNPWYLYLGYAFLIVGAVFSLLVEFILQVVILNMAHHQGSVKAGFNLGKIWEKMGKIGYKNLLFAYIIVSIALGSLILFLSDMIKSIPIMGTFVLLLLIEPYLLLFTTRVLGLIDRI